MKTFKLLLLMFLITAGTVSAGELDNYYLQQFADFDRPSNTLFKTAASTTAQKCGMPLKLSLKRDWKNLELSTQTELAKYVARPALANEATLTSTSGRFVIHYATTGIDAPSATYLNNGWIQTIADTFDYVYNQEIGTMGYPPPQSIPTHIYLKSMGYFGLTDSDVITGTTATSYITIENDFSENLFQNSISGGTTSYDKSVLALQITAAHEFHHAIQFRMNYYFEPWFAEATSSWMEDEVYDPVNQLYSYLYSYVPNTATGSLNSGLGYDRWIFNRLLAENHTVDIIKSIWTRFSQTTGPVIAPGTSNEHINMIPDINAELVSKGSSLGDELISFAKRLYTKEWTTHISEIPLIYSSNPTVVTYPGSFTYPINLSKSPSPSVTLPQYAFTYFRFIPKPSITNLQLTLAGTSGIQLAMLKKTGATFTAVPQSGNSFTVNGFGSMNPATDEVILIIANTTSLDGHSANFSTDGTFTTPAEPVPAPVIPPTSGSIAFAGGGSGGGGGCFIATAAYGSYLHPKVMVLREFRDRYLLTNSPGRAFVDCYYRISPPIAEFIKEHDSARAIVRFLLVPIILAVSHLWLTASVLSILALLLLLNMRKKLPSRLPSQGVTG